MIEDAVSVVGNLLREHCDSRGLAFSRIAELIVERIATPPEAAGWQYGVQDTIGMAIRCPSLSDARRIVDAFDAKFPEVGPHVIVRRPTPGPWERFE